MIPTDLLVLNLEEVRRRSLKVWRGIPDEVLGYKSDSEAMSIGDQVRHVLEGEFLYMSMLLSGGSPASEQTPWSERPLLSIDDEIAFAEPYRQQFLGLVRAFSADDLLTRQVDRSERGYVRPFGDFVLRIAYHEAVHTGSMLQTLRGAGVVRPNIWD